MPREFEFSTPIDGTPDVAWAVLTDFDAYPQWSHLVPFASGATEPGARVLLRIRGPGRRLRPFRPTVVSVDPSRELVFEASLGHHLLVHMVHYFTLVGGGTSGLSLRQRWVATGLLVPVLWPLLRLGMARFREFGADLNARVSDIRSMGERKSRAEQVLPGRVGVIPVALEGAALDVFRYLLLTMNRLQPCVEMEILPTIDHPLLTTLRSKKQLDRQLVRGQLSEFYNSYCAALQEQIQAYDLPDSLPPVFVVLSNSRFTDNYYGVYYSSVQILALGNWSRHMAPPSIVEFFAFLTLRYSIGLIKPGFLDSRHLGTKGCFWDFTPALDEVRYKILTGFVCADCRKELHAAGLGELAARIPEIVAARWLGSVDDQSSPAAVAKKLGYDLFVTKGLKPTSWERIRATLISEAPKQILSVLGTLLIAALLLWLGIQRST